MSEQTNAGTASKRTRGTSKGAQFSLDDFSAWVRDALEARGPDIGLLLQKCWRSISDARRRGETVEAIGDIIAEGAARHSAPSSFTSEAVQREILAREAQLKAKAEANARSRAKSVKKQGASEGSDDQSAGTVSPGGEPPVQGGGKALSPITPDIQAPALPSEPKVDREGTLFSSEPPPRRHQDPAPNEAPKWETIRSQLPPGWAAKVVRSPTDATSKVGIFFMPDVDQAFLDKHRGKLAAKRSGDGQEVAFWKTQSELVSFTAAAAEHGLLPDRIVFADTKK